MKDENSNTTTADKLLSEINSPATDSRAKTRAIRLAMSEFTQHQQEKSAASANKNNRKSQGFWLYLRPISNFFNRKKTMQIVNNKFLYSGLATLSIALVGTTLFQQSYRTNTDIQTGALTETTKKLEDFEDDINVNRLSTEPKAAPLATAPLPESISSELEISHLGNNQPAPLVSDRSFNNSTGSSIRKKIENSSEVRQAKKISLEQGAQNDKAHQTTYSAQGRDKFSTIKTNTIKRVEEEPVSTFSIDVDTASYSFVRRQLNQGVLPQKNAVRAEELINYFDYNYPLPENKSRPFKPSIIVRPSPWNQGRELIHIGIKGYELDKTKLPRSNIVLLLDVSGSMNSQDKLPLVKQSMSMLLDSLRPDDTVGIVVYAGAAGTVLEPTAVKEKQKILNSLKRLNAGGSTAGGEGIQLAYQLAEMNFDKQAVNRIMLATDGDFNVGIRDSEELKSFVERKRDQGIFLSVLGFGQGNYNDELMQTLAQNGNGIASYIDSLSEAQKVLVNESTSSLFPIAKDVKIQVEFNPDTVSEYRLVGYETRHLNREDFNNDKIDAGDIGAGHSISAIYEITPKDSKAKPASDPLRYTNKQVQAEPASLRNEYGFVKIRYKLPEQNSSQLISQVIKSNQRTYSRELVRDADFASAVAGFAQLLRGGEFINDYSYSDVIETAQENKGRDEFGYRTEFIQLARKAQIANEM